MFRSQESTEIKRLRVGETRRLREDNEILNAAPLFREALDPRNQ